MSEVKEDLELTNFEQSNEDSKETEKEHLLVVASSDHKLQLDDEDEDLISHGVELGKDKEGEFTQEGTKRQAKKKVPIFAWVLLILSLFAVSSAASVLKLLNDVPPNLKAAWRLQVLCVLLIPGSIYEWLKASQEIRFKIFEKKSLVVMFAAGFCLALHFSTWITSLDLTTMAHSLLFVCSTPILIVLGSIVLSRSPWKLTNAPSMGENLGSLLGFVGMGVTLVDSQSDKGATIQGDLIALLGALAFVGYMMAGKSLRSWIPIFIYSLIINLVASSILLIIAAIFEDISLFGSRGAFGWFTAKHIGWVLYLGFVPGIFGHTAINLVIKYIEPLIVTVFLLMEPVIGSFLGWASGVSGVPGLWTWLGSPLILGSMVWVTVAQHKRSKKEADLASNEGH